MTLKVATRLIGQSAFAVAMCAVIGLTSIVDTAGSKTHEASLSATSAALRNHQDSDMMHDALRGDVLFALLAANDEERRQVEADLAEHSQAFRERLALNEELSLGTEVKAALNEVRPKLDSYIEGAAKLCHLAEKDKEAARAELPAFMDLFGDLEEKMEAVSDTIQEESQQAERDLAAAHSQSRMTTFGAAGIAGVILLGLAVVTLRSILKPLRECVSVLTTFAKGDLTQRATWTSKDEFGELAAATNTLAKNVGEMIKQVQQSAVEVASASTEIASSANEMSNAIGDVARQTTQASGSAAESGRIAKEGGEIVTKTISGMGQINNAVSASATSVAELGNRGKQIGEIIRAINEIADQTNLLALNAAIEAARAGEHGRGFAVVADEVRKLADRTTTATEEVGESIKAIQKETELAVSRMSAGTEHVKTGVELATKAGTSLQQIVTGATDVAGMVQSIAAAAEEAGAGAQQSAAAAAQLSSKAEQLQSLVGQFRIA